MQPPAQGAQAGPVLDPNGPYYHQVVVARTGDALSLSDAAQVIEHASVPDGVRLADGTIRIYYVNGARHGLWVAEMSGGVVTPIGPISLNGVSDPAGVVDPDAFLMPDGTMRLAYSSAFGTPRPGQGASEWSICLADSKDGISFNVLGRAIRFTQTTTDPSLARLSDGSWLMAVSQGTTSVLARSGDGLSFEAFATLDYGGVPEITVLPDGRVRLYVCASGGIWSYATRDRGTSWHREGPLNAPSMGKAIVCDPSLVVGAGLFVYKTGDAPSAPARGVPTVTPSPRPSPGTGGSGFAFRPPACDTTTPLSVSPIDLAYLTYIVPLGNLNPSAHTFPTSHTYMNFGGPEGRPEAQGKQVAVRSPGKAYVVDIGVFETSRTGGSASEAYTEYKMELAVCGGIRLIFGHMGPVSDKLLAAILGRSGSCQTYETGGYRYKLCGYFNLEVPVDPGESLGMTSGRSASFDFGAYDESRPQLKFTRPERYPHEARYNLCPYDLYAQPVRDQLFDRIRTFEGVKPKGPVCGATNQDLPGTAQGNWFLNPDIQGSEDTNLALVHLVVADVGQPVLSIGTSLTGLQSGVYSFAPRSEGRVNRDFGAITSEGGIYCFENLTSAYRGEGPAGKIVILQLLNADTLRIEVRSGAACGSGPWSLSASSVTYRR